MNFLATPSLLWYLCTIITSVPAVVIADEVRTRFTFRHPTLENALPILIGSDDGEHQRAFDYSRLRFNHDHVGITRPTPSNDPFPSCVGYPRKGTRKHVALNKQTAKAPRGYNDATTLCSNTDHEGWRILRFEKRVGIGKRCYRQVRDAVLDWNFETRDANKSMGILTASRHATPGKKLLATFTEILIPVIPPKSLFVVNPVRVVYTVKDAFTQCCLSSSTAYATLRGHLLSGEERVTAVWRKDTDEVFIEIVSFSRASPSLGGCIIWPLIGHMQNQFFLSEMNHLASAGQQK